MSSPASTPSLKVRILATAGFALFLAIAVFGAYKGIAPTATASDALPATLIGTTPGTQAGAGVAYLLQLAPGAPGEVVPLRLVEAGGLTVTMPTNVSRDMRGNATVTLLVDVPAGTPPGAKLFTVQVGQRLQTFTLNVLAPKAAPAAGTMMTLDVTFRLADGSLWDTTVESTGKSGLPKHPSFPPKVTYASYTWRQGDSTELIPLLGPTLDKMVDGETRTIVLTPENTPGWLASSPVLRNIVIPQNITIPRYTPNITVTNQALATATQASLNDTRNLSVGANVSIPVSLSNSVAPYSLGQLKVTFQVANRSGDNVTIAVREGGQYTLYGWLPNATTVLVVNETIVLRTTPVVSDATVAFPSTWGTHKSKITAVTGANFTLTHFPEVGTQWTRTGQSGETITLRVKALTADQVVTEEQNPFSPVHLNTPHMSLDLTRRAFTQR